MSGKKKFNNNKFNNKPEKIEEIKEQIQEEKLEITENPSVTAVKSLELNEIESSKVCPRTICKVIVLYSDGSYSIQE